MLSEPPLRSPPLTVREVNEVLGVLSLALWSLIFVVTIKYVVFLMRADNHGEGGVLALTALARRALGKRSMIALVLGASGAALFYGDAIITPALSVLSAVEGLKTLPGAGGMFGDDLILFLTIAILIGLFAIQSRGTASVVEAVRAGVYPVVPVHRRARPMAYLRRVLDRARVPAILRRDVPRNPRR